jgi:hypothetical protein
MLGPTKMGLILQDGVRRMKAKEVYFIVKNDDERSGVMRFIQAWDIDSPLEVVIREVSTDRTTQQNRLQYRWFADGERQSDQKAWEIRAYCKLHFGVPILRRDSEEYREKYDRLIRPMSYEQKLELMVEPFDFPVTSAMTVKQHMEFLDAVQLHLSGLGVQLTNPAEFGLCK